MGTPRAAWAPNHMELAVADMLMTLKAGWAGPGLIWDEGSRVRRTDGRTDGPTDRQTAGQRVNPLPWRTVRPVHFSTLAQASGEGGTHM